MLAQSTATSHAPRREQNEALSMAAISKTGAARLAVATSAWRVQTLNPRPQGSEGTSMRATQTRRDGGLSRASQRLKEVEEEEEDAPASGSRPRGRRFQKACEEGGAGSGLKP